MAFVLYKGIEWRRRITVTDDDTGARTNLTGKTIEVHLRRRTGEATLIELTVGSGITLLTQSGATEGQADLVIQAASSTSLEVASHVICVLVEGQIAMRPTKLPVSAH
jgi:hypothetical protein